MNRHEDPSAELSFPRSADTPWLLGSANQHYPLFDGGRLLGAAVLCLVLGSWISLVHKSLQEPSAATRAPLAPALAQPEQER